MVAPLAFERPALALEAGAAAAAARGDAAEAARLTTRAQGLLADLYGRLTPWQRVEVARHPARPHFGHFAAALSTDFTPLAGDRTFGEDAAILGGPARLSGRPVMLIGHVRGEDTASRLAHNFAMPRPEGYRKVVRLVALAGRLGLPVVTLVDTPGAFPGVEAEERGQAEAIAASIAALLEAPVPVVAVITGEGGSGGAVALAAADRLIMLEHAVYSVISPEGCAAILWPGRADRAVEAAEALRLTAADCQRLGVADRIVYEPPGGAHRDHATAIARTGAAITEALDALSARPADGRVARRRARFRRLAVG